MRLINVVSREWMLYAIRNCLLAKWMAQEIASGVAVRVSVVLRIHSRINRHIRERHGRRFCGRHTGPVAVEFTVFLRARLQPPLSTGVEHTLAVETISLSSLPTPMWAPSRKREGENDGKNETERVRKQPCFSFSNDVSNNDFNHRRTDKSTRSRDSRLRISSHEIEREFL